MNTDIKLLISKLQISEIYNIMKNIDNIPYAIVKGETLSIQAYNKPGMRRLGDVDILIDRIHVKTLEKLLCDRGFICQENKRTSRIFAMTSSHQLSPYYKQLPFIKMYVDINFDIFWGEYNGKRVNIDKFLCDTVNLDIYDYTLKVLPPVKSFIHLILHHYKDMNSIFLLCRHKSINCDMFKDVYNLIKNNRNNITVEAFRQICLDMEIQPYAYYILYYTSILYNDAWLKEYVNAVYCSKGVNLLECYGLCDKERKQWKVDFMTRLDEDNLYSLVEKDLGQEDIEKIERNRKVFG